MYQPVSRITITQRKTDAFPSRNKVFTFNFLTEVEIDSSWKNLTDTAKITFPKNVYFKDESGQLFSWLGKSVIGNNNLSVPPILLRGDKITIELGYFYQQEDKTYTKVLNPIFSGFISKVTNKIPITIEAEDNMYLLKQVTCPNKVYKDTVTVQEIIQDLLSTSPDTSSLKVVGGAGTSANIKTSVGSFRVGDNETIAQVLERIRKDYKIESYFKGDDLRCSGIVYYPEDSKTARTFDFQGNIPENSDQLEYRRLDDIKLGVKAYSVLKEELTTTNSKGQKRTKNKRLETFVGIPGGEVRTLYFWDVKDIDTLKKLALERLPRFYYEGYRGKFLTFGLPTVEHGNIAIMKDAILPERQGEYLIKGVKTTSGMSGFRQEIELDVRVDGVYTQADLDNGV